MSSDPSILEIIMHVVADDIGIDPILITTEMSRQDAVTARSWIAFLAHDHFGQRYADIDQVLRIPSNMSRTVVQRFRLKVTAPDGKLEKRMAILARRIRFIRDDPPRQVIAEPLQERRQDSIRERSLAALGSIPSAPPVPAVPASVLPVAERNRLKQYRRLGWSFSGLARHFEISENQVRLMLGEPLPERVPA